MLSERRQVANFTLTEISKLPSVLDAAAALACIYDFAEHPYFKWASSPTTRLEDFRASQAPYLHYVEQFSRALTVVLGRTSTIKERLATVFENVAEEHGHGRFDGSHRNTYEGYLRAVGVRDDAIYAPCSPRFYVASQSLLDFCLANPVEMGAAAVGIIEYTHIKIARLLAEMIHRRFWGDLDAQRHYRLHAEIDADHALSLFELCHDGWKEPRTRERIAFAMAFSVQVWWSQFESLLPAEPIKPSPTDGIRHLLDRHAAKQAVGALDMGRLACDVPVRMRHGTDEYQEARAISIGEHGLVVRGIAAPPVDADVEVVIDKLSSKQAVIPGRVRSSPNENGEFCIEFLMGEPQRAIVRAFVCELVGTTRPEAASVSNTVPRPVLGGCDHVGVRVTDAARARAFYEFLGFRLDLDDTWEEHRALGMINDAGFRINLIYNAVPRPSNANILQDEPVKWAGLTHLALSVENIDEVAQFLSQHGITITEGPWALGNQRRICFIRDPDNNVIEFTERWSNQPAELVASR